MADMTSRQRWLAILNRQEVDRIPTDYWATPEVTSRLLKDLNCRNDEELFQMPQKGHP